MVRLSLGSVHPSPTKSQRNYLDAAGNGPTPRYAPDALSQAPVRVLRSKTMGVRSPVEIVAQDLLPALAGPSSPAVVAIPSRQDVDEAAPTRTLYRSLTRWLRFYFQGLTSYLKQFSSFFV